MTMDSEAKYDTIELTPAKQTQVELTSPQQKLCKELKITFTQFLGVAEDLMVDVPITKICERNSLPRHTVDILQQELASDVGEWRGRTTQRLKRLTSLALRNMENMLESNVLKPSDYSSLMNMLVEKHELLEGKPTTRSESNSLSATIDVEALNEVIQNPAKIKRKRKKEPTPIDLAKNMCKLPMQDRGVDLNAANTDL